MSDYSLSTRGSYIQNNREESPPVNENPHPSINTMPAPCHRQSCNLTTTPNQPLPHRIFPILHSTKTLHALLTLHSQYPIPIYTILAPFPFPLAPVFLTYPSSPHLNKIAISSPTSHSRTPTACTRSGQIASAYNETFPWDLP